MPKISIIVPVYNTEKYLARCIDSILAQTYTDFELILVNDGSEDNSGKICDNYALKDSRIIVIHKENKGASSARNAGIKKAKGVWVSFIDSDDYITETYLFDFPKDEVNDIEICGFVSYNGQEFTSSHPRVRYEGKCIIKFYENLFKYRANTSICAKIIKRNIMVNNNILFDSNMTLTEDTLFNLNLLNYVNTIQIIPNTNYYYNSPADIIQKYNITPKQIKYNLERLITEATNLTKKYNYNICKVTEPIKYFQFSCFNYLFNSADKDGKIYLLKQYRKYKLFKYRPKMNYKESLYLLLQLYLPYLMTNK